jgi:hypothetical protein
MISIATGAVMISDNVTQLATCCALLQSGLIGDGYGTASKLHQSIVGKVS